MIFKFIYNHKTVRHLTLECIKETVEENKTEVKPRNKN